MTVTRPRYRALGFAAALAIVLVAGATTAPAAAPLPRSTPEAQGVSSRAVVDFVAAADKIDTLHSFMLLRHGHVIAEGWWKPEAPDKPHVLWSLSKSFTSTAIGLAINEGKLKLDDPVLKFFPDLAPADPSDNLKAMKVRDLLTMTCGHDVEPKSIGGTPTVKAFLAHPVPHVPGTHFQYNTLGSYTLSAIVTKVTGQTVLDYLKPRLFEPLGIEKPEWDASPEGNSLGGYGLKLCTEDIAKFGQLYLQKGKWAGKQLVPESWVEQATSKQVPNDKAPHGKMGPDWREGYGFQFWRCTHGAFRGDGAAGQFIVVMPEQDAVIVITAQTGNMQGELNAVWEKLLPAFQAGALAEDAAAQAKLKAAVDHLEAHPAKPAAAKPTGVTAPGAKLKALSEEFTFAEGPACDADGNVYFTDQPNDRIVKWTADGKFETFMQPSGRSNGLCFDAKGNLIACADDKNELWSIDVKTQQVTVLVKDYHGKLLNAPNDVWVHPGGGMYLTDPWYPRDYWKRGPQEQDGHHVYYLSPDRKTLARVTTDLTQPNGIIGTSDGKTLYVSDLDAHKTYSYRVNDDGTLADKKLFCEAGSDGMTIDDEGNVYLTNNKGVTVYDKAGKQVENIPVPAKWTGNVCFAGKDGHTLFVTAGKGAYAIQMRVKGAGSQ